MPTCTYIPQATTHLFTCYVYFAGLYVFLIFVYSSKILFITYYCNIWSYILCLLFFFLNYVCNIQVVLILYLIIINKAIRDGKYLARHMPVLGNVHPIKIEKFDIFS